MEDTTKEGEAKKPRKKRKTSPRPDETIGNKRPGASEALRRKWQDPEWRAALLAKRKAIKDEQLRTRPRDQMFRKGVPDGMRKEEAMRLWDISRTKAKETMANLRNAGVLDGSDPRGEEALEKALEVMRSPMNQQTCLAAAKLVLEYTKAKPVAKSELTVNKAEDWLAAVIADAQKDNQEDNDGV